MDEAALHARMYRCEGPAVGKFLVGQLLPSALQSAGSKTDARGHPGSHQLICGYFAPVAPHPSASQFL